MGTIVTSLGAAENVAQPMRRSQTNSERSRVLMDIHSKDCRCYLRFSGCTQAIRIPSIYDALIIVHYQLLNPTTVPSISSTFYSLCGNSKEIQRKWGVSYR